MHFTIFPSFLKLKLSSIAFKAVLSICLVAACVICRRLYILTRAVILPKLLSPTTTRSNIIHDLAK